MNLSRSQPLALIVDDMAVNAMVLERMLRHLGWRANVCHNGHDALQQIQQQHYDLALIDAMMPGMSGPETIQAIRALGGHYASVPIAIVTADAVVGARERYLDAGANHYITKPVMLNALTAFLDSLGHEAAPPSQQKVPAAPAPAPSLTGGQEANGELAIIDPAQALKLEPMLGLATVRKLYLAFANSSTGKLNDYLNASATGTRAEAVLAAHAIKGAASTAGFPALAACAASAESGLKQGQGDANDWVASLQQQHRDALAAGNAFFKIDDPSE